MQPTPCHSPVARHSFLAASASFAFRGLLWKELGGGVGGNSRPQPEDTFPLLDLLSAEKPKRMFRHDHSVALSRHSRNPLRLGKYLQPKVDKLKAEIGTAEMVTVKNGLEI